MTNTKIRKPTADAEFANKREVQLFFSGWLSALDNIKKFISPQVKIQEKELLGIINIKIEQGNMMYTDELEKIKRLDK